MILKYKMNIVFLICSFFCFSQNKVCQNENVDTVDLNTIGKCAIEKFKASKSKEFVQIKTRKRFVRAKKNYLSGLKKKSQKINKKPNYLEVKKSKELVKSIVESKSSTKVVSSSSSNNSKAIRFDVVSSIPVFIECANYAVYDRPDCVKETFENSILDNFVYPFDAASEGIEGRVWVRFIIDTEGYVKDISTTGPSNGALLEKEAKRLVNLLPKFVPGMHNGDYVSVEYFLPIDFQLHE